MALTRIRVLNQQSTYNVDRLNANTLVVGGNTITGASGPGIVISNVVYLSAAGNILTANAAPTTGNSLIKIVGSGFIANANVYLNGLLQPSANVTFVNSTELRLNMPALATNTYSLMTFNSAGAGAIYYQGVRFDPYPIWTTGAYSTTATTSISVQLLVTGYGSGTVTFSLSSGNTLPSGITLSANGLLTGITTSNTYSFYVDATDSENEITTQQITLTVNVADAYFPYTILLLGANTISANITGSSNANTVIDSSNNGFTTAITANTTQGTFTPFPTTGTWSNYFNGSTDYLTAGSASNWTFLHDGSSWTIETWVYTSILQISGTSGVICGTDGTSGSIGFNLGMGYTNTNDVYVQFFRGVSLSSAQFYTTAANVVPINTWTHVAVTFNTTGKTGAIYINGVSQALTYSGTSLSSFAYSSSAPTYTLAVGRLQLPSPAAYFPGYISNLRISNSVVYNSNFTPSTIPLTAIANTVLLTCQANRFIDSNTTPATITVGSNTAIQHFNPFGSNVISYAAEANTYVGSTYFNGTTDILKTSTASDWAFLIDGTTSYTVEAWINTSDVSTTRAGSIFSTGGGYGSQNGITWFVGDYNNGDLAIDLCNGSGHFIWAMSSASLSENAWHHIAYTFQPNGANLHSAIVKIFYDGVSQTVSKSTAGAVVATYPSTSTLPLWMGAAAYLSTPIVCYYVGYINNFRITKGLVYTSTFTPSTVPLSTTSNTIFLTCQTTQTVLRDANTTPKLITIGAGTPRPTKYNPFTLTDTSTAATVYGGSYYFNKANPDSIVLPVNSLLNLGANNFTIEAWVYPSANVASTSMIIGSWDGSATLSWLVSVGNPGSFNFSWTTSGSYQPANNEYYITNVITCNSWNHLAVVRNATTLTMYVNGTSVKSNTMIGTVYNPSLPIKLGTNTNSQSFLGYISNPRILTGTALYTSNFTPPTVPLTPIANTQLLLSGTNSGIYDSSMNTDFINIGGVTTRTDVKNYGSVSYYFNGSSYLHTHINPLYNFGTGDFTVEAWIYQTVTSVSSYKVLLHDNLYGGLGFGWVLYSYNNQLNLWTGSSAEKIAPAGSISLNTWTHVAWTRTSGQSRLYINATQVGSTTADTTNYVGTVIYIGASRLGGFLFSGYMQDIRITKGYARTISIPATPFFTR
jgi:hypothetical protein